ncbi:metal-sensing transcriptional repressor [Caldinitratiruptor microaerophilus]|uniref:Uncharacterized protein n=1 Tax=Caldinitratiruptor microaerophilus TaxID=671077 RepID=A0AA35CMK2_9FIRM|nr:metal-sensing transcriptional repressor [Caldinitratiruptor microaerophilus]BDG61148.1 hypothetical protein caldi_22380 [Caldinitratiruptor microaerophilus]
MNPTTSPHKTRLDPETRKELRLGLQRMVTEVQELQRMLDEDRYCVEVLFQVERAREVLRLVGRLALRSHLKSRVTEAVRRQQGPAVCEELKSALLKFAR